MPDLGSVLQWPFVLISNMLITILFWSLDLLISHSLAQFSLFAGFTFHRFLLCKVMTSHNLSTSMSGLFGFISQMMPCPLITHEPLFTLTLRLVNWWWCSDEFAKNVTISSNKMSEHWQYTLSTLIYSSMYESQHIHQTHDCVTKEWL